MHFSGRYRHNQTLDIDLIIFRCYPCTKGVKVRAHVINRRTDIVYETKTFTITKDQYKNWIKVDVQR
jgi:hypothetical protein